MEARSSLLSCGSQRPVFHLSLDFLLLLLLLHHLWKVCLFSPRSLLWLRRWGHGAQWWAGFRVQISALICSFQAAFSFLPSCLHEVCSLYRHFLLSPRRSRRCNLFIGAVKSTTKGLMNSTHNSRKCPDSEGVLVYLDKAVLFEVTRLCEKNVLFVCLGHIFSA